MKLLDLIYKLTTGKLSPSTEETRRRILRVIIGRCPVCELDLESHAYAQIATVLVSDIVTRTSAAQASEARDWSRLKSFQDWDAESDVLEYGAIRCNRIDGFGIVIILFTADLWSDEKVVSAQRLSESESRSLAEMVGDRWQIL